MCDRQDIGISIGSGEQDEAADQERPELTRSGHPVALPEEPRIFIYDNYPGGIGFSEPLFGMHDELLRAHGSSLPAASATTAAPRASARGGHRPACQSRWRCGFWISSAPLPGGCRHMTPAPPIRCWRLPRQSLPRRSRPVGCRYESACRPPARNHRRWSQGAETAACPGNAMRMETTSGDGTQPDRIALGDAAGILGGEWRDEARPPVSRHRPTPTAWPSPRPSGARQITCCRRMACGGCAGCGDASSSEVPKPPGRPTRALFVDLETTGLAGGAGTYAFLVGCAWFDGLHLPGAAVLSCRATRPSGCCWRPWRARLRRRPASSSLTTGSRSTCRSWKRASCAPDGDAVCGDPASRHAPSRSTAVAEPRSRRERRRAAG